MKKALKKVIRILAFARFPFLERAMYFYCVQRHALLIESNKAIMHLIQKIKGEVEMQLSDYHAYILYQLARSARTIEGDVAEAGVYQGGSTRLIWEAMPEKTFHVFDTFEGLPELHYIDDPNHFQNGYYAAGYEKVQSYLKKCGGNVILYKGLFPSTAQPIENKRFSFVHLDMDLYEYTKAGLEFFYPRMERGGIIVIHDYPTARGVYKACNEFFESKSERLITLFKGQAFVIKL